MKNILPELEKQTGQTNERLSRGGLVKNIMNTNGESYEIVYNRLSYYLDGVGAIFGEGKPLTKEKSSSYINNQL